VLRQLSPLEKPGLGTFDYLEMIPEIDSLYLFFRQWMYFIELDLPIQNPPIASVDPGAYRHG
jgi:hypothetical protein